MKKFGVHIDLFRMSITVWIVTFWLVKEEFNVYCVPTDESSKDKLEKVLQDQSSYFVLFFILIFPSLFWQ